ncbi:MAG: MFS transporter [Bacteroidetes bacterium]|nr:MAG: MFS transporter [Bacteroidota bacterium]
MHQKGYYTSLFNKVVIVAALGYFVDIYDLVLFGMERVASLRDIFMQTLPAEELVNIDKYIEEVGTKLLNWQMFGMLVGGIIWGVLADKKGRLSVLFGSIITYSVANVLNGMVNDTTTYAVLRFVSGFGLAGELGAGVTLVSETMPKEKRGMGTTMVATIGLSGAVFAGLMTYYVNNWRMSYYIGGALGFLLLLLRIGVYESGMYSSMKRSKVKKGNFMYLFSHSGVLLKYLSVIVIALPVWYVTYMLIQFAPEMTRALGMHNYPKEARIPIMVEYMGVSLGDLSSGFLSQKLRSRKKALYIFIVGTMLATAVYFLFVQDSLLWFYFIVFVLGYFAGYWAVFMATAAESFGTNIRGTVATTAPNFVRGSVPLMSISHLYLRDYVGTVTSAIIIGVVIFALALWSVYQLEETFHKELNYVEGEELP